MRNHWGMVKCEARAKQNILKKKNRQTTQKTKNYPYVPATHGPLSGWPMSTQSHLRCALFF